MIQKALALDSAISSNVFDRLTAHGAHEKFVRSQKEAGSKSAVIEHEGLSKRRRPSLRIGVPG